MYNMHFFLPRNQCLKLGAYYTTEHRIVNFFTEIANAFTGAKSYDKSDWCSKTRTQSGNNNKLIVLDI